MIILCFILNIFSKSYILDFINKEIDLVNCPIKFSEKPNYFISFLKGYIVSFMFLLKAKRIII